jgi:acyl carrier protein
MSVGSKTQENQFAAIADAVFDQVRRSLPTNADGDISLDSRLDEIGLDSIARMDVLNRVEAAFGMRFSEDALYDMATCRDVIEYVEANASRGTSQWRPVAPAPRPLPQKVSTSGEIPAEHRDVTQFPE